MEPRARILRKLRSYTFMLRLWRTLQVALWSTLGAQVLMIFILPAREFLGLENPVGLYLAVTGIAIVGGCLIGALVPVTPEQTAHVIDAKLHLQERVQSALEVDRDAAPSLAPLLTQDALKALTPHSPRRLLDGAWGTHWAFLPAVALSVLAILALPPLPIGRFIAVEKGRLPAEEVALNDSPRATVDKGDEAPSLGPPETQMLATEVGYKDSGLGDKSPDFSSIVEAGDDRMQLLDKQSKSRSGQLPGSPVQIEPQAKGGTSAGFESGGPMAEEASARLQDMEELMREVAEASEQPREPQSSNIGGDDSPESENTSSAAGEADSNEQGSSGGDLPVEGDKGASKKATMPASETPGTPSGEDVETPGRSTAQPNFDQDQQTARFGGGQYPHDAPGAGFPDWMKGDRDPQFMDAGQGEGASTGKTSGQAGVGHAELNFGEEATALELPEIKDIYVKGKVQEGDSASFNTEMLGRTTQGSAQAQHEDVLAQYAFQAEAQMSRNKVPAELRSQVQAYFSRIR